MTMPPGVQTMAAFTFGADNRQGEGLGMGPIPFLPASDNQYCLAKAF
jgi:hypothetical protein